MKLKLFFLIALLVFAGIRAGAQTADRIKYYIIYDVSGSVPMFDPNGNLRTLLDQFIRINQQKATNGATRQTINSYADFIIYFIGGQQYVLDSQEFLSVQVSDSKASERILKAIEEQIKGSHKQKYTYLHTALTKISDKIQSEKESGGVFIYTDGMLADGDFAENKADPHFASLSNYRLYINELIGRLQNIKKKPVYIIQSSPTPWNYFSIIPDGDKYPANTSDVFNKDHWFWVKAGNAIADSSSLAKKSFANFIDKANLDIVTISNPITPQDYVGTALKTQEIMNLTSAAISPNLDSLVINALASTVQTDTIFRTAIKYLRDNLKKQEFSQENLIKLKKQIKALAANPELLQQYEDNMRTKMAKMDSVPVLQNEILTAAYAPAPATDIQAVKTIKNAQDFQTAALNGLADYLIDRTKQEATYAFMENINEKFLNASYQYREIGRFMMPNLKTALQNPQAYSDLDIMKTAFRKDVQSLPDNLVKNSDLFIHSEGLVALKYYYQLYKQISQNSSLEQAFSALADDIADHGIAKVYTLNNSTSTSLSKAQQSILFTARLIKYLNGHDISILYKDKVKLKELSKLLIVLSVDADNIKTIKNLDTVAETIKDVYNNYRILNGQIKAYKELINSSPTTDYSDYKKYKIEAVTDILKQIAQLMLSGSPILENITFCGENDGPILKEFIGKVNKFDTTIVDTINGNIYKFNFSIKKRLPCLKLTAPQPGRADTVIHLKLEKGFNQFKIDGKDYGLRILNYADSKLSTPTLEYLLVPQTDQGQHAFDRASVIRQANNCLDAYFMIKEEKYLDAVNLLVPDLLISLKNKFRTDTAILTMITSTLEIAGEVSAAKSSDDIKNIIARYALPVASYKVKRASNYTFMLNAYTGFAPYTSVYTSDWKARPAIIAPIGLEISMPLGLKKKYHKSLGLLLSVIDVGNIIDYRLLAKNDDNADEVVNLARVFAPGLFLTVGASHKIPLSLIGGYQMNPGRFTFGLTFDLPIVSFWRGNF